MKSLAIRRAFGLLAVLIAAVSLCAGADRSKARDWKLGILTGINGERGSYTVNRPPVCNYVYNAGMQCTGGGQSTYSTYSTMLAVSDGERTCFAERGGLAGRGATENIPIIFALDKDQKHVIFMLDDGTEHKMRLIKRRINTADEQAQQCSLVGGADAGSIADLITSNPPLSFGWFSHCFAGAVGGPQPQAR